MSHVSPVLIDRVRGEYREMPGLRLTLPQACRLWQVAGPACESVLEALVNEGFLLKTSQGAYVAGPTELRMRSSSSASTFVSRRGVA
jgi:hypothetical protein